MAPVGAAVTRALVLLACLAQCWAFYLPGMYPVAHAVNSTVAAKVNSLTSVATGLKFNFYDLPFCKPEEGVKKADENFGELLEGDLIENSPYKFRMRITQQAIKVCDTDALSEEDVKHFEQKIDDVYRINLLLDNLPVTTEALEDDPGNVITGIPVGYKRDGKYYVYNHLIFKVLIHEYKESPGHMTGVHLSSPDATGAPRKLFELAQGRKLQEAAPAGEAKPAEAAAEAAPAGESGAGGYLVVGFEVAACSIAREPEESVPRYEAVKPIECINTSPQAITAGSKIVYTFDVMWEESPIHWASRWDAYLKMNGDQVHWFSILNSIMVISFLAGMVFVILLRSVHRDLAKIEQMDKEEAAQMAEESGWKLVVGDVFRAPPMAEFLCILVADGVQIICMAAVTIFFAALGFMSPASRGALLMGMIFLYLLLGIAAGYVGARLWVMITGTVKSAAPLAMKIACFFPGVCAVVLGTLNLLLWAYGSSGAVPFTLFFYLFFLWFMISVPLTVAGTNLGMKATRIQYPVRTNQIPRQIPEQRYPVWLLLLGGGILPFGTLYIELFFIMSSMWMQRVYYCFGFLFLVLILLIIVCAEVAVVFTYLQLTMEDYRWWWRSFFASGSVAFYAFLYSINYLFVDLHRMSGTLPALIYLGYCLIMVLAILLATGSVGFLSSTGFVYYLFASVKLD